MDEETGEINYTFDTSVNAETGEEEYMTYCLDKETGEKQYYTIDQICNCLQMPNLFKISRYSTTQLSAVPQNKLRLREKSMEFITAIVFLMPTFIIFTPLLGVFVLTFDVILHRWCHRKNSRLGLRSDDSIYYQSPLHMLYKEFCSKCIAEEEGKKMSQLQDKRYQKKRSAMKESFRRVVT